MKLPWDGMYQLLKLIYLNRSKGNFQGFKGQEKVKFGYFCYFKKKKYQKRSDNFCLLFVA